MKPAQKALVVFLITLVVIVYFFRLQAEARFDLPEGVETKVRARVTRQPYLKGSYQNIWLGPIFVKTERFPGYFYGDRLEVIGKFEKRVINKFQTEYYAFFPTIHKLEESQSGGFLLNFRRFLFRLRGRLEKGIAQLLPEPQSGLLIGILLGSKKTLPEKFLQNLRDTGTLHIVVASGYNLTVVAGFLVSTLVWLVSRKKALIFAFLGVVFYTLMVGAEPPVVRAAIMASLAFGAGHLGRMRDGLISLIAAVAIMLLISPLTLFDIGFQLSFMATAGIILIYPVFKEIGFFRWRVLGDNLATTLAAQTAVTPIILLNFGNFSFLSPLINALVLPWVPFLMNLGALMTIFSLFVRPVARVIAWVLWLPLTYFVRLIEWFGRLSWVNWQIEGLPFYWGVGYYLVVAAILWWSWKGERKSSGLKLF